MFVNTVGLQSLRVALDWTPREDPIPALNRLEKRFFFFRSSRAITRLRTRFVRVAVAFGEISEAVRFGSFRWLPLTCVSITAAHTE